MKSKRLLLVSAFGLGLTLILLGLLQTARAASDDLFAKPDGSGTACTQANPCILQTALAQANDDDTIYVAQGIYTGTGAAVITVTKSITLYGGWDGTTATPPVRDADTYVTTLDGEGARRVVHISGNITPTLDGLIIARGNATGLTTDCVGSSGNPDGCGGGIFVHQAHPIIVNNVITNNVAAITTAGFLTGTTGYGGGLYLRNASRAVISGNLIISNTGSMAYCGNGGGLYGSASGMLVQSNRVISNYATTTNATCAWGGGISGGPDGALIQGNLVEGNWANGAGGGFGAGLYQWYGSAHYLGNLVQGNQGSTAVYLGYSRSRFEGNWVVGNATSIGIKLFNGSGGGPTLVNNVVARSGSRAFSAQGHVTYPLTGTLLHNTLVGSGTGYGVYVETGYVTLFLTNTTVASHTWGITNTVPASSTVSADHTLFWANDHDGIRGTNPVDGDPAFVDPGGGDYHIGPGSAATDAGVDAGVTADIDGDPRPAPAGTRPDLGADEINQHTIFLPLVLR